MSGVDRKWIEIYRSSLFSSFSFMAPRIEALNPLLIALVLSKMPNDQIM